tara:strand:- start:274 stop:456 length:183 start_codon:yes stop_codon:yes gene_type:complete
MCLICVELTKNKLTTKEARRNLEEMHEELGRDHIFEILRVIWKKEDEEDDPFDMWFSGSD